MPTYLIQSTLDRMRHRLQEIQKDKIKVAKDLAEAASFGDLSENAEYEAAKERKEMLALEEIRHREWLSDYQLIEELQMPEGVVALGKRVRLLDRESDEELDFAIVGEHDRLDGVEVLSISSPLAQGILNKKTGRTVEVQLPRGARRFKILEVADLFS
ncbi:MAG: GreA/GreB family elongation factor [Acidobacteria bacterium]|nr:GreA/GreB family elongation factor [Acidobacteriota bacterium]